MASLQDLLNQTNGPTTYKSGEDENHQFTSQSGVDQQQQATQSQESQPTQQGSTTQAQQQTVAPSTTQQQITAPVTSTNQTTNVSNQPAATPVTSASIAQNQSKQVMTPATRTNPKKTGSGYTNLNRIMMANQGNRLGSTVAGGIQSNINGLQSGVQSAQQKFLEEANKNRLDTAENAAARQSVLDRFDESKVNVDESKFQLDQKMQDEYDQKQKALQADLDKAKATGQGNVDAIKAQMAWNSRAMDVLTRSQQQVQAPQYGMFGDNSMATGLPSMVTIQNPDLLSPEDKAFYYEVMKSNDFGQRNMNTYGQANNSLQNLLNVSQAVQQGKEADIDKQLKSLASQMTDLTEAEKQKWIQSEKNRIVTENLPNQEETENFRKYVQGAYGGPKELGDYQNLLGKAQQTEDLGNLARIQGGRQELLKQFVGGRDYTAGQRNLDEAIMGQSPDSSLLSKISKKARGAEESVQSANKLASAQAQDFTNRAKQFGEQTKQSIANARQPLSNLIEQERQGLIQKEESRKKDFTKLQDILSGKDEGTKTLDKNARLGLALQSAQDAGYLSEGDITDLTAKGGLIDRANKLGLDPNQMIMDRLQSTGALGIDRRAAATEDQEKRVSALDRLLGKTGTDVEFGTGQEQYKAGNIGVDTKSLIDYINKTEQERLAQNPGYGDQLKAAGLSPLQQMLSAYVSPVASGLNNAGDIIAGRPANLADTAGAYSAMGTQAGVGALGLQRDISVGALKSLNNLVGGNKQIGGLIDTYDKLNKSVLGSVSKESLNQSQAFNDLANGKIDQAVSKWLGIDAAKNIGGNVSNAVGKGITDVSKALSTALNGGSTGNWAAGKYNTVDFATGKPLKIRDFANRSSDDILQQMLQVQIPRTVIAGNNQKGIQGSKEMNELLKYYNDALKREGKA